MTNVRLGGLEKYKWAIIVAAGCLLAVLALALMANPAGASPDTCTTPECGGGGGDTGDITAPDTSINTGPPSLTNQTSVTFTYSANEAPATFECRLETPTSTGTFSACGGPTSATTDQVSQTYSGLTTNGTYTFHVKATDGFANTDATPATRQFTVDTQAPVAPTINTRPPELVNTRTATWTFSSEPGATFQCSIDSTTSFNSCSSGQSFTVASDGMHTFRVKARDAAGNTSPYAEDSWTVDTVRPDTSIQTGPSGLTNNRSASFTFSSNESGSSFQCSLSGPSNAHAFGACPTSYSGLADGTYTFQVRAIDPAGNVDLTPASRTWTVDGTAPVVNITGGPEEGSTSTSRSPSFTFSASEAVSFFCKLDGAATFTACSSPQGYSNLADGPHTFSVKGRDAAGNESDPVVRFWTVDATPPSLSITSGPSNGDVFGPGSTQAWTFDAGDATEVQCKVALVGASASYGPCNGGNSSHSVSGLSEGSYEFWVKARDGVGNVATVTRQFTIDATAPNTTITSGPPSLTKSTSAAFGFSSEAGVSFECKLDSGTFAPCSSPKSYSGLSNGSHTFSVRAKDAAGNTDASPASRTWKVDTIKPTISGMSPRHGSITSDTTPTIKATVKDNLTNLRKANIKLYVNGVLISATKWSYSASTDLLVYNSPRLSKGKKTVKIVATDAARNVGIKSWYFTIR